MSPQTINKIDDLLKNLPEEYFREVEDFISFLLEKEKKKHAFEDRVIAASKAPKEKYSSADELMKAIDETD